MSHFGLGFGSDQSIDYTGPLTRTVEDAAAALQATAGYDDYDPRQRREVPLTLDVLSGLDRGVSGLRIGIVEEGFGDHTADPEVKDLVLAAVDVLARAGARVKKVSIPAHLEVRTAQQALGAEGALAVFKTGFYGAFTRSYYPAGLLSAINTLWFDHADVLAPRTRLNLVTGDLLRKNYGGRVYAKAQNVRPTYIKAYDDVLADVDILVMPTSTISAPKNYRPATLAEALELNLSMMHRLGQTMNAQQFNFTGHPALAVPVGKTSAGLPASIQLVGRFFDDPLLLRAAYAYQHSVDWEDVIRVGAPERVAVFA